MRESSSQGEQGEKKGRTIETNYQRAAQIAMYLLYHTSYVLVQYYSIIYLVSIVKKRLKKHNKTTERNYHTTINTTVVSFQYQQCEYDS